MHALMCAAHQQMLSLVAPPERSTLRWWRDSEDADVFHLRRLLRGDTAAVVEQRLEEETARVAGDGHHEHRAAYALAGLCASCDKSEAGRAVVLIRADAAAVAEDPALQRLTCDSSVRLVTTACRSRSTAGSGATD